MPLLLVLLLLLGQVPPADDPPIADAVWAEGVAAFRALPEGARLYPQLVAGGVRIRSSAEELAGSWGYYDGARRVIVLDPGFIGQDARTVATILLHEAIHAVGALDDSYHRNATRFGPVVGCMAEELTALRAEREAWRIWWGDGGRLAAAHPYEQELNATLALYLNDSTAYNALVGEALAHCRRSQMGVLP